MLGTISRMDLDRIRDQLRRNAAVFDRRDIYLAGVEDTVAAIVAAADDRPRTVIKLPQAHTADTP